MTKNVIALVGGSGQDLLAWQSRRLLDQLPARGLAGHVLDIGAPDFAARLNPLLEDGVLFAWGYGGAGARLTLDRAGLWEAARVPFVSVMAEAPFVMPVNHHVRSSWVVNGYLYREWLDMQRSLVASPQVSAMLPLGVAPNPHAAARWDDRPNRMVFLHDGADPARQRRHWAAWPPHLRAVLHDAADELAAQGAGPVLPVVQAVLGAHDLSLDGARHLLFGLLHELDSYIHALRADAIATALLGVPADIVGTGWDHLHDTDGAARFHPPVDATERDALLAETQMLVTMAPNLASGPQDQVLQGLAAGCRVVADNNDHARAELHALPSYTGIAWNDPGLADRLAALCNDPASFQDRTAPAQDHVRRSHDPLAFLDAMAGLAEMVRMQDVMAGYALDAA